VTENSEQAHRKRLSHTLLAGMDALSPSPLSYIQLYAQFTIPPLMDTLTTFLTDHARIPGDERIIGSQLKKHLPKTPINRFGEYVQDLIGHYTKLYLFFTRGVRVLPGIACCLLPTIFCTAWGGGGLCPLTPPPKEHSPPPPPPTPPTPPPLPCLFLRFGLVYKPTTSTSVFGSPVTQVPSPEIQGCYFL
jgi:hypothetical protein